MTAPSAPTKQNDIAASEPAKQNEDAASEPAAAEPEVEKEDVPERATTPPEPEAFAQPVS